MSLISIARSEYGDVYQNLERAVNLAGPLPISEDDTVVVKINMRGARTPETGAITHPKFLNTVLRYLRKNFKGLEVCVVESDSHTVLVDLLIKWLGFLPVLEQWNAKWVHLSKEKIIKKRINGRFLKEVPIPAIFEDAFFISVPKLET